MANKTVSVVVDIDGNISNLEAKLSTLKTNMSGLLKNGSNPQIQKAFDSISKAIDNLKAKTATPINAQSAFNGIIKETQQVTLQVSKLTNALTEISKSVDGEMLDILPPETVSNINKALGAITSYSQAIEKATEETVELSKAKKEQLSIEEDIAKKNQKLSEKRGSAQEAKRQIAETQALKQAAQERIAILDSEIKQADKRMKELQKIYSSAEGSKLDKRKKIKLSDGSETTMTQETKKKNKAEGQKNIELGNIQDLDKELSAQSAALRQFEKEITMTEGRIAGLTQNLEECGQKVKELTEAFNQSAIEKQKAAFEKLRNSANELGISLEGVSPEGTAEDINKLTVSLQNVVNEGATVAQDAFNSLEEELNDIQQEVQETTNAVNGCEESFVALTAVNNKLNDLQKKATNFLGAAGAAKIFTTTLRQAFSAVKELDAVMTEMAVVTDFSIGDFWDQMPEYTARANELGLAIKDVYKAQTLFYQQGLNTTEATELTNQTLKMAKIAGLDAAEATDRMTAALRGFNMELNETSAQKVADVYSELAAITASDVDEISTAMTKTASIASSAGMEFETTAAFLSQIIETTRESAETAGTAMKTVIARFQELKKDPSEIGEVDGEIVDANKIETALRSVGVALRDSSGQFRDLDDVFMELAGKWDTLDTNTQRYIATIAAGSRQQSRFIAMMSDYERTQELVTAAQTSAGASSKQYEKTLDSLESKLAKLENAWTEFTTGIMNSDLVKFFVDLLTNILTAVNKLSNGLEFLPDSVNNALKPFSKIGMVLSFFNLAKRAVTKFSNYLKTHMIDVGTTMGNSIAQGVKAGLGLAKDEVDKFKNTSTNQGQSQNNVNNSTPPKKEGKIKQIISGTKQFDEAHQAQANAIADHKRNTALINNYAEAPEEKQVRVNAAIARGGKNNQSLSDSLGAYNEESSLAAPMDIIETSFTAEFNTIKSQAGEAWDAIGTDAETLWQEISTCFADGTGSIGDVIATSEAKLQELINTLKAVKAESGDGGEADAQAFSEAMSNGNVGTLKANDETTAQAHENLQTIRADYQAETGQELDAFGGPDLIEQSDLDLVKTNFTDTLNSISVEDDALWESIKQEGIEAFEVMAEAPDKLKISIDQYIEHTNAKIDEMVQKYNQAKAQIEAGGAGGSGKQGKKPKQAKSKQVNKKEIKKNSSDTSKNADKKQEQKKKQQEQQQKKQNEQQKKATKEQEEAKKKLAEQDNKLANQSKINSENMTAGYKKMTTAISDTGANLTAAGIGVSALGDAFTNMGLEEVGSVFNTLGSTISTVGTIMSVFGSITSLLTPIISMLTATTTASTVASGADAAAKGVQAGANTTVGTTALFAQACCWPLLLIMLAIIAVIAIFVVLVIALKSAWEAAEAASPEGQLKAAEEAAEDAAEAADRAAEAYTNLKDSLTELDDKYKALEDLTRGTREWNDAVQEINNSVLDLIDEYPELAAFVENKDGVLHLDTDSKEVQDVLDQYQMEATKAKGREYVTKMEVVRKKQAVAFDNLTDDATYNQKGAGFGAITKGILQGNLVGGPIGAIIGGFIGANRKDKLEEMAGQSQTDAMAKALAKGAVMEVDGELVVKNQKLVDELGLTASTLNEYKDATSEVIDELEEYGQSLVQGEEQIDAMYAGMAMNALASVDTSKETEKVQKQMNNLADAEWAKQFEENALKEIEDVDLDAKEGDEGYEEAQKIKQAVASQYGEDAEVDGNTITYTDENGDEQEVELTNEQFKQQYAAMQATENMTKALEHAPAAFAKIEESARKLASSMDLSGKEIAEAGKAIAKVWTSKDGKDLTQNDLRLLDTIGLDEGSGNAWWDSGKKIFPWQESGDETALYSMWDSLSREEKEVFGSYENFYTDIKEAQDAATESFKKSNEFAKQVGVTLNQYLTADITANYVKKLEEVAASSGEAGAQAVQSALDSITAGMSESDINAFYQALNGLDWKNVDDLESLPQLLKDLGVSVPTEALKNFIEVAKDAADAIHLIDFNKLEEQMKNTAQLFDNIKSGEQGRALSEEDYQALLDIAPELANKFQLNNNGEYVYLGESMEDLADAIRENTTTLIKEGEEQLEDKISTAEILQDMVNETGVLMTKEDEQHNEEMEQKRLEMTQSAAQAEGMFRSINNIWRWLIGDDSEALTGQQQNIVDSFNDAAQEYENKKTKGTNMSLDINRRADWGKEGKITYLDAVKEKLLEEGVNLSYLGINGLSNETDFAEVSEDKLDSFLDGLQKILADKGVNEDTLKNVVGHLWSLDYQKNKVKDNVLSAKEKRAKNEQAQKEWKAVQEQWKQGKIDADSHEYKEAKRLAEEAALDADRMQNALMAQFAGAGLEESLLSEYAIAIEYLDAMEEVYGTQSDSYQDAVKNVEGIEENLWKVYEAQEKVNELAKQATFSYNYLSKKTQEISAAEHKSSISASKYNRLNTNGSLTKEDVQSYIDEQIQNLQIRAQSNAEARLAITGAMEAMLDKNGEFGGYAKYVSYENGVLSFDEEKINEEFKNKPDEMEKFTAYYEDLQSKDEELKDLESTAEDILDEVEEIRKFGQEDYIELLNAVAEGLVYERQQEIDKLTTINESINESNQKLINKIQEQIDEERQSRELEKQKEALSDKYSRLMMLQSDTSGSYDSEIAQLEKEILEDEESLQDSLIDQALQDLTKSSEKAQEQRERQIALLENQLETYEQSKELWADAKQILDDSLDAIYGVDGSVGGVGNAVGGVDDTVDSFTKTNGFWQTEAGKLIQQVTGGQSNTDPITEHLNQKLTENQAANAWAYLSGTSKDNSSLSADLNKIEQALTITDKKGNSTSIASLINNSILADAQYHEAMKNATQGNAKLNALSKLNSADIVTEQQWSNKLKEDPEFAAAVQAAGYGNNHSAYFSEQKAIRQKKALSSSLITDFKDSYDVLNRTGFDTKEEYWEKMGYTPPKPEPIGPMPATNSRWTSYQDAADAGYSNIRTASEFTRGNNTDKQKYGTYQAYLDAMFEKYMGYPPIINGSGPIANGPIASNVKSFSKDSFLSTGIDWGTYTLSKSDYEKHTAKDSSGSTYLHIGAISWNYFDSQWAKKGEGYTATLKDGKYEIDILWGEPTYTAYKTGGLVSSTGPAWLDGTKSKPEYVLNPEQTARFFNLIDVLQDLDLAGNHSESTSNNGDNYFDININVDSVSNDYDVEQMADKIKSIIYEDSVYRNVNAINHIR